MWNALTPDIKLSATVNVFQENVVSFAARELQVLKLLNIHNHSKYCK